MRCLRWQGHRFSFPLQKSLADPKSWIGSVVLLTALVGYTVAGAFIFQTLEAAPLDTSSPSDERRPTIALANFLNSICDQFNGSSRLEKIIDAIQLNPLDLASERLSTTRRRFSQFSWVLYYCGSVYTTIGYGDITPSTAEGRLATVIYALLGVPLFLMVLSDIGQVLAYFYTKIGKVFRGSHHRLGQLCSPDLGTTTKDSSATAQVGDSDTDTSEHVDIISVTSSSPSNITILNCDVDKLEILSDDVIEVTLDEVTSTSSKHVVTEQGTLQKGSSLRAIVLHEGKRAILEEEPEKGVKHIHTPNKENSRMSQCVAIVFFMSYALLGAMIFVHIEDWSYINAIYFVVVSLLTIGFGDLSPSKGPALLFASLYIVLGLALASMYLSLLRDNMGDAAKHVLLLRIKKKKDVRK